MKIHFTILAIFVSHFVFAQNSELTELLNNYSSEKQFNGVVLLATNGKIDFLGSVGIGNRQDSILVNTKSKFKIASVTKVFTAVMIMKLVEQGSLSLNGTIGDYLKDYLGQGRDKVTIHHLLTYSSGIENQLNPLGIRPYQVNKSLDEFIALYCSGDLVYKPGEKSAYGNTEYILLHKIIETVTGITYENYLSELITAPLGMKDTEMVKTKEITPGLLSSYTYDASGNVFYNDAPYYPELYFGAGGLYSTAEDLLKFDQALFNSSILNRETTELLLTIHDKLGYTAYGLWGSTGWGEFNEPFYYRTGTTLGSTVNWIHTMDTNKTIIVLSNTDATNLFELSTKAYLISKEMNR